MYKCSRGESMFRIFRCSYNHTQFGETNHIAMCFFTNQDIERHPVVKEVLEIYGDK